MNNQATSFETATGLIDYGMTNDYMFRAVLQTHEDILKALVCSVLHLKESEIKTIEIRNPIELGTSIDSKSYGLDLKLLLDNSKVINLEMQVKDENNCPERSLGYLCRSFDNLNKGMDYAKVMPTIHIGFLDFTLFREYPEFHATYMLMNIKNHNTSRERSEGAYHIYSSKFMLKVIELNHIELATEEDKKFGIDSLSRERSEGAYRFARIFKAKTWEELRMCAGNDETLTKTAKVIYDYNSDFAIRDQCEAREAYYARERGTKQLIEEYEAELAANKEQLAAKDEQLAAQAEEIARLKALLNK